MAETLISAALTTWALMIESEIVLWWFAVTTIVTVLYAMKTNHLTFGRLLRYAGLFALVIFGIEGPKMHYIAVVLDRPLNNPAVWTGTVFNYTFFTCILVGIGIALLLNKLLNLIFGDPWLSVARWMYHISERCAARSEGFRMLGATSIDDLHKLAELRGLKSSAELSTTAKESA